MLNVVIIHPNYRLTSPRSIRVSNIVNNIFEVSNNADIRILTFKQKIFNDIPFKSYEQINYFSYVFIALKYFKIFRLARIFFKKAKQLDPLYLVGPLIKADIKLRISTQNKICKIICTKFFNVKSQKHSFVKPYIISEITNIVFF